MPCSEQERAGEPRGGLAWPAAPRMHRDRQPGASQGPQALCRGFLGSLIRRSEGAQGEHGTGGDQEIWFCLRFPVPFSLGLRFPFCTECSLTQPYSHPPVGQLALQVSKVGWGRGQRGWQWWEVVGRDAFRLKRI